MATRGLPMTAQAAAFPGETDNVRIILELGAGAVSFEKSGDRETSRLELAIVPIKAGGTVLPSIEARLPLALDAATAQVVRERGVRVVQAATLPPGDYQLRIAVRDPVRDMAGAVICEVTVPDSEASPAPPVGAGRQQHARRRPAVRQPRRGYGARSRRPPADDQADVRRRRDDQRLRRDGRWRGARARDVTLTTIVRDAQDREVVRQPHAGANAAVPAGRPFGFAADLPLRTLAPGRYVLRVEARVAGATDAAREMPFEVTP